MIGFLIPSPMTKLPIRLSVLEKMLPLSYDLFAWLCRTGIEHQRGPSETRMPWGINVPKLTHARPSPPHETCNSSRSFASTHGQRTFRSRSPAPAMIPQAHVPDNLHVALDIMQDQRHIQDDAYSHVHATSSSSHETCNSRVSIAFTHRPRMSRSRSPAPAMIPRALVSGTFHDAHVLMRDAHTLDDAGEDDSMPALYDEYTDQVLPHGSFGDVRHGIFNCIQMPLQPMPNLHTRGM